MLDVDFFDSDDDAFFAEVSNSLPDCGLPMTESLPKLEKESLTHNHSHADSSSHFKFQEYSSPRNKECLNVAKISLNIGKNSNKRVKIDGPNPGSADINSKDCGSSLNISTLIQKSSLISNQEKHPSVTQESDSLNKNTLTPDITSYVNRQLKTSVKSNSFTPVLNSNSTTPENSTYINKRFTPGFTPKARKRIFAWPVGLVEDDEANSDSPDPYIPEEILGLDKKFKPILSSEYSTENLSLLSWRQLQTDVSSHLNLLSIAKFCSIQRVLHESSKKKLPKHLVVPVLCVILKEVKQEKSPTVSVFMDDTGEIDGKIKKDVFSKYKDYMVEGAAMILKKITFLCNMLILNTENLVSIYLPDGTKNMLQSLEFDLDMSETLKPMDCKYLKQSLTNRNDFPMASHTSGTSGYLKPSSVSYKQSTTSNFPIQECAVTKSVPSVRPSTSKSESFAPISSQKKVLPGSQKTGLVGKNPEVVNNVSNEIYGVNNSVTSTKLPSLSCNKTSASDKNLRSDTFLEDFSSDDDYMDEFDELLGNLDEKSFMDAM